MHSFAVRRWELEALEPFVPPMVTWAHHGEDFVAAVENGPLAATQFHPEKSGDAGATLLENWLASLTEESSRPLSKAARSRSTRG